MNRMQRYMEKLKKYRALNPGHDDFYDAEEKTIRGIQEWTRRTVEAIDEAMAALEDGSLHVFDTSTFTVEGAEVTTYMADVDTDADNTGDTEAVSDGYFHESEYRSAPYFDLQIDGITLLDTNFG